MIFAAIVASMFIDSILPTLRPTALWTACGHVPSRRVAFLSRLPGEKSGAGRESSLIATRCAVWCAAFRPITKRVDIEHEDIPGFMPSMTMPFEVRDEKEIADLKIGDAIAFRLNVTQRDSWIDRVEKIDSGRSPSPRHAATATQLSTRRNQSACTKATRCLISPYRRGRKAGHAAKHFTVIPSS